MNREPFDDPVIALKDLLKYANLEFPLPLAQSYLNTEVKSQEWLWHKIIPKGAFTIISGPAGVGKNHDNVDYF